MGDDELVFQRTIRVLPRLPRQFAYSVIKSRYNDGGGEAAYILGDRERQTNKFANGLQTVGLQVGIRIGDLALFLLGFLVGAPRFELGTPSRPDWGSMLLLDAQ